MTAPAPDLAPAHHLAHTRPEVADQPMPVVAALAVMSA